MATKRIAPRRAAGNQAASPKGRVRLEDVLSKLNVFGGSLEILKEQLASGFERVDREIASLNERVTSGFAQVERRFERVDQRFEQVDQRFEQIDRRFENVDQ